MSAPTILLADVGSTFTKALHIDPVARVILGRAETPTTLTTDVMHGVDLLADELGARDATMYGCSSAGGGLRLAVVGYERSVTAEAGQRVGLSAGAKVVHVAAGAMGGDDLAALTASAPDIVLLVGGTDGGNADVLRHNAAVLAAARLPVPIVVAGNTEARADVLATLAATDRHTVVADNVMPAIGSLTPGSARSAIREAFLSHVIGGKGLSSDPRFRRLVEAATPDAVLQGIGALSQVVAGDLLVVDIGGATTDVYSVVHQDSGRDEGPRMRPVIAQLTAARSVEGDLGMRWNARNVLQAATAEGLGPISDELTAHAAAVHAQPKQVASGPEQLHLDRELARLAALIAVRRHARPGLLNEDPRGLGHVAHLIGSGGVLRHGAADDTAHILDAVLGDYAGGWPVPVAAQRHVDQDYVLFAVGLLRHHDPATATWLAGTLLH